MKNFIQNGDTVTAAAPADGVKSGQAVLIGGLFGVASTDAEAGAEFELCTRGVFELPKVTANTFAAGAVAYFKADTGEITSTASSNKLIGAVIVASGNGEETARVRLNGVAVA